MENIQLAMEYSKELSLLYIREEGDISLSSTQQLFIDFFKSVESATNQDGLQKYKDHKQKYGSFYDLVIIDIEMPKLDGLEMTKKIKTLNSIQNIILITADNEINYLKEVINLGISRFLVKPIDHTQFNDLIYKVVQSISDYKALLSHLEILEELTINLEIQNRELLTKNEELEHFISLADTPDTETLEPQEEKIVEYIQDLVPDIKVNETYKKAQIEELVNSDLYELREILTEIDTYIIEIINDTENISELTLSILAGLFSRYAALLGYYSFFSSLSTSLTHFSSTIQDRSLPKDKTLVHNIFVMIESFIYVLNRWHDDISSGNDNKINQFDASIISDINTITNMWLQNNENKQTDKENLDDIFNF
ncbi:MAG: response regulator [Campylobacterota bacterium]|nr:response regulator [Campylobacterota bacterium]